jgi:5'-nucleotidase
MELKNLTNFPWFLSNVYDKKTGNRLGDAEEFRVFERGGIRIGIFGLAEKEWLDTLLVEYLPRCHYLDFVDYAIEMVRVLKEEQKCDIIIALTHMMGYNDAKLVNKVDGIDLVLGGHDHMIRH